MRRLVVVAAAVCALWAAPGAFASGWCGTGGSAIDRPDTLTGPQVHAIWAVPSDGGDTFATGAPKLADDLASITSWWQGQDPTRVPRIDVATFGETSCADISYVRLPDPASAFGGGANAAFTRIQSDLAAAGFANPWKKYYVYFDGPSVQGNVCGTGGGEFDTGPAYAVVWLAGCPGVPTDSVGAHELVHALGALPVGAPHACTVATDPFHQDDPGHPCDSALDVLYPANSGSSLSSLYLDWNHDDYYGHAGSWADLQDSVWMHRLDLPQLALTVAIKGAGRVTSDVPGIDCAATCTTAWDQSPNLRVLLSPVPRTGSRFVRWLGGCTNGGYADCAVDVTASGVFTAVFGPARVPVRVSVAGRGKVVCTPACSPSFAAGRHLTLVAKPASGWRFVRWSGACKGTRPVCRPSTDYALSARATFRKR